MIPGFLKKDSDTFKQTRRIITQWNQQKCGDNTIIRINSPQRWAVDGRDCLIEPFIEGFFKINSNNGWCTDEESDEIDVLQALSHFSYHISSGQFALCDIQGGIFRDGIILTDPVILSESRRFGPTDLHWKNIQ